jgi:aspartate/methionine/tyrosine aminotransferase
MTETGILRDENHTVLDTLKPAVRDEPESGIVNTANYVWKKGGGVIPMWVGEGSVPTPEFICRAANASLARGETFYTWQRGIPELREALARYHTRHYGKQFDPENFYVTSGGMQAVQTAVQAVASAGSEIVMPSPAWPNHAAPLRMHEVKPVEVPMRFSNSHWHLDLDQLFDAVNARTSAIIVNSPSNPIGMVIEDDQLIAIRDFCRKHGLWIIADEVYGRFYYPQDPNGPKIAPSFHSHCDAEEQILYVNTFSKNWAMTGWRIGWVEGPRAIGQQLENLIQYNTSGTATFMQHAAVAALDEGEEFLATQVAHCAAGLDYLSETLGQRSDVQVQRPDGSFYYFFKVDGITDSGAASKRWIDEINVGLAPGTAFGNGGDGWFRMCFAGSHENLHEAADRLGTWLDNR